MSVYIHSILYLSSEQQRSWLCIYLSSETSDVLIVYIFIFWDIRGVDCVYIYVIKQQRCRLCIYIYVVKQQRCRLYIYNVTTADSNNSLLYDYWVFNSFIYIIFDDELPSWCLVNGLVLAQHWHGHAEQSVHLSRFIPHEQRRSLAMIISIITRTTALQDAGPVLPLPPYRHTSTSWKVWGSPLSLPPIIVLGLSKASILMSGY